MAIARFLDRMCLALRASGLWLCYAAKVDPFLSLDCARVEGVGAQSKERKVSHFAAQRSRAIVLQAQRAKHIRLQSNFFSTELVPCVFLWCRSATVPAVFLLKVSWHHWSQIQL